MPALRAPQRHMLTTIRPNRAVLRPPEKHEKGGGVSYVLARCGRAFVKRTAPESLPPLLAEALRDAGPTRYSAGESRDLPAPRRRHPHPSVPAPHTRAAQLHEAAGAQRECGTGRERGGKASARSRRGRRRSAPNGLQWSLPVISAKGTASWMMACARQAAVYQPCLADKGQAT